MGHPRRLPLQTRSAFRPVHLVPNRQRVLVARPDFFQHLLHRPDLLGPLGMAGVHHMDEDIREKTFVNGVVTVVDAHHILRQLGESHEAEEQIAFADVLLLNKCDLVSPQDLDALEKRLREVNALATVHRTTRAAIGIEKILEVGGFNLDRATEINPHFLDPEDHHHHHTNISSVGIEAEGDCDGRKLNDWVSKLLREQGQDLFRMKGVFAVKGQASRVVFQGVHMLLDAADGGPWAGRPRKNALVFIGRNLDREALNKGFSACLA